MKNGEHVSRQTKSVPATRVAVMPLGKVLSSPSTKEEEEMKRYMKIVEEGWILKFLKVN